MTQPTQTAFRHLATTVLLLGALLLSVTVAGPTASAQEVPVITDDVVDTGLEAGDQITVPIEVRDLDDVADVTSYQFDVDFSGAPLSFVEFDTTNTLTGAAEWTVSQGQVASGVQRMSAATFSNPAQPLSTGGNDGTMVKAVFEVTGDGGGTVTFPPNQFTFNGSNVASDLSRADFQVITGGTVVNIEDATFNINQAGTMTVTASDLTGMDISSFDLDIQFEDPATPTGVGNIQSGWNINSNFDSGTNTLTVSAFDSGGGELQGGGTIFDINLEAISNAATLDVSFDQANSEFLDSGGNEVTVSFVDGTLHVVTNSPPNAMNDEVSTTEDDVLSVTDPANGVLANDTDPNGDDLSVSEVEGNSDDVGTETTLSSGALLTLNSDGTFEYDPNGQFEGLTDGESDSDSFTYTAADGFGGTDQATVTVTINGQNDPPVFTSVPGDTTANVNETLELDFDADPGDTNDSVTYSLVDNPPANTSIDPNTGLFSFTPVPEQRDSTYTITVQAEDAGGLTTTASVDVTVEFDVLLGDITDNGDVSAFDANRTLLASLGLSPPRPLSIRDSIAADVTANGEISAGDASAILRFVVGDIDSFSEVQDGGSSSALASGTGASLEWGDATPSDGQTVLPIRVQGDVHGVYAVEISVAGDLSAVDTENIEGALPESWQMVSATHGSEALEIAMAGSESLERAGTLVRIPLTEKETDGISLTGSGRFGEAATLTFGKAPVGEVPGSFELIGNSPNPFRTQTTIAFDLPAEASVQVEVYDMLGRRVVKIPEQKMTAGTSRKIQIDASNLSSGVYLYRLKADGDSGSWTESGRMVIGK